MEASFQHLSVIFLSDVSCTLKTAYMKNISKRKEFINLNEHVKIETSSNIREYVARDTSSIKRRTKKQAEHSYARECGGYAKRAQGGCLGTKSR